MGSPAHGDVASRPGKTLVAYCGWLVLGFRHNERAVTSKRRRIGRFPSARLLLSPRAASEVNQRLYRGILEFLRNLVVVTFLFVLAQKSGSWLLWALWGLGAVALYGTVAIYLESVFFNASIIKHPWVRNC